MEVHGPVLAREGVLRQAQDERALGDESVLAQTFAPLILSPELVEGAKDQSSATDTAFSSV
jgi:hypothetical protein